MCITLPLYFGTEGGGSFQLIHLPTSALKFIGHSKALSARKYEGTSFENLAIARGSTLCP